MVRRIKAIAAAASTALLDSLRSGLAVSPVKQEEESDQPMGVLVRNAFREEAADIDMSHVWTELSGRVKGPFGMLAVEGPAFSYSDGATLIASHGHLDAQSSSADYNHPLPASDQVHTTMPYKGADIHMANLR
jgi:hypothetical protein